MAHLVLDITAIPGAVDIGHADPMRTLLLDVARDCDATVLQVCSHQFSPTGATAILLLCESHMSIHTYPETRTVHIDFYHCGHDVRRRVESAIPLFAAHFQSDALQYTVFER